MTSSTEGTPATDGAGPLNLGQRLAQHTVGSVALALALGAVLGGVITGVTLEVTNRYKKLYSESQTAFAAFKTQSERNEQELQLLRQQAEKDRVEASNLRMGASQMTKLFGQMQKDWEGAPSQPSYRIVGKNLLVYWTDGRIWREYFLYGAKGRKAVLKKMNTKPMKTPFLVVSYKRGENWHFAVAGVNARGTETKLSEVLDVP